MIDDKMQLKTIINNVAVRETAIWIVALALLTISNTSVDLRLSVLLSFPVLLGMMVITYINKFLFIPKVLEKKGVLLYVILSAILVIGFINISNIMEDNVNETYQSYVVKTVDDGSLLDTQLPSESKDFFQQYNNPDGVFISEKFKISIYFICTFLFNFITYYMRKMKKEEEIKKDLEQQKISMELKFLRSQINPHFLFNALNNIYSMVYMNDKNAADSVLILSEMLRYVTDESSQEKICLKDELHYIENYINFQRFSYENSLNLTVKTEIEDEMVFLSPMLLEPFVENSFKYSGVGFIDNTFLNISIKTKGNKLYFTSENSKGIKEKKGKTEREGVGMKNVMKRLDLLYPDTHKLVITETDAVFKVDLELELQHQKTETIILNSK